jgi:hypothetical protein
MVEERGAQRATQAGEGDGQSRTAVMDNCAQSIEGIDDDVGALELRFRQKNHAVPC